ncbi:hypothetical protein [Mycobacterium sp. TY815]|uniref:hypothetical protein n=2 Tax=Mycobacterium TaxID=1763 RepID=UPI0026B7CC38
MTITAIQKLGVTAAVLLAASLGGPVPASADDDPPMHQVVYTISAKNPIYADIYYQDQDPSKYSDYSHNPYTFTPNIQADIAPGRPWSQQVMLINPDAWAMVSVSTGRQPGTPGFHCTVSVDGNVVVSKDGAKGVLCSLRTW